MFTNITFILVNWKPNQQPSTLLELQSNSNNNNNNKLHLYLLFQSIDIIRV